MCIRDRSIYLSLSNKSVSTHKHIDVEWFIKRQKYADHLQKTGFEDLFQKRYYSYTKYKP